MVTYEMVKNDPTVRVYIQKAGEALKAMGFPNTVLPMSALLRKKLHI